MSFFSVDIRAYDSKVTYLCYFGMKAKVTSESPGYALHEMDLTSTVLRRWGECGSARKVGKVRRWGKAGGFSPPLLPAIDFSSLY